MRLLLIVGGIAGVLGCTEAKPPESQGAGPTRADEHPDRSSAQSENRANAMSIVGNRISAVMPQGWVRIPVDGANADSSMVFQIPNPADEGTPDSANAVVAVAKWRDVKAGGDLLAATINQRPGGMVVNDNTSDDGRRVILARGQQDKTPYLELDMIRSVKGLMVLCMTSYPLLEKSTKEWDEAMMRDFKALASSVQVDGEQVFPGADPTATGKGE